VLISSTKRSLEKIMAIAPRTRDEAYFKELILNQILKRGQGKALLHSEVINGAKKLCGVALSSTEQNALTLAWGHLAADTGKILRVGTGENTRYYLP
jgi:hypothetical protein